MQEFTQAQVERSLRQLGRYRCRRAQEVSFLEAPEGVTGLHVLALGMRETGLKNIRGGAIMVDGTWVKQPDPNKQDVGFTQISQIYHERALSQMVGVPEGEWAPDNSGSTAAHPGYCPRFTDALRYTLSEMHESMAFAEDHDVPDSRHVRFVIAAHNAGQFGALQGLRDGDVDKNTAGHDYSAWVIQHVSHIRRGLNKLKWTVTPGVA